MGTSAWYAPGAAAAQMVEAIIMDQHRVFPVCAYLTGQYNMNELYIGVPVVLSKNGVQEIVEIDLDKNEKQLFLDSAKAVKSTMNMLDKMKLFD
ncbi:MAG: malate dehydrogenase, partial [Marinilabiliales bacterium]